MSTTTTGAATAKKPSVAALPPLSRELLGELLLNIHETAAVLHVKTETIRHLHRMGRLPAVRVGKCRMWTPATIKAFVAGLDPEKDA